MSSYRHSTHAGNFADVIKHIVVLDCLEYLSRQAEPYVYIDTHAGAGLFELKPGDTGKLPEYISGIAKLIPGDWPELASYLAVIQSFNEDGFLEYYPGSPAIATRMLREHDTAWLYELHPEDFVLLHNNIGDDKRVKLFQQDGYVGLHDALASFSARALFVLLDPPYEIESDYDAIFDAVKRAHETFTAGIYALWYPVVDRRRIDKLEKRLINSGIRNIQRYELGITSDNEQAGMTAAGMIVINPPGALIDRMSLLLPRLLDTLSKDVGAAYGCDVLVAD